MKPFTPSGCARCTCAPTALQHVDRPVPALDRPQNDLRRWASLDDLSFLHLPVAREPDLFQPLTIHGRAHHHRAVAPLHRRRPLAARPGVRGGQSSPNTHRQRLRTLRVFFERIIEWDWPDAPARNPILNWDLPPRPEPLPRFLDDQAAAKVMAVARASSDPRDRLVVEVLARTGIRAGELVDLAADAVVQIGANHWLRIPLGKLRTDRYVPLHPQLVDLLADWTATNLEHIRVHHRLVADHRGPLNRHIITRIIHRIGRIAGVPGVHPHQLRHTLATQAINRGMRLEAIAALLGHRKMEMTLIYARIANRVVADEYAAVSAKIDALYGQQPELPADYETTGMARLRRETHARMLGNGLCTRPAELDCRMESACETCAYFRTSAQFLPILTRQRDHAQQHGQPDRAALFDRLIQRVETGPDTTKHS